MPDEHPTPPYPREFTLHQVDQARTDFAAIESDLEFLMQRINRLPTAADLWRATLLIAFVSAVLGIVGIEAFWRYSPACSSNRRTRMRRRCSVS